MDVQHVLEILPLPENIVEAIEKEDIYAVSVLSGNRNFEGRISPHD